MKAAIDELSLLFSFFDSPQFAVPRAYLQTGEERMERKKKQGEEEKEEITKKSSTSSSPLFFLSFLSAQLGQDRLLRHEAHLSSVGKRHIARAVLGEEHRVAHGHPFERDLLANGDDGPDERVLHGHRRAR